MIWERHNRDELVGVSPRYGAVRIVKMRRRPGLIYWLLTVPRSGQPVVLGKCKNLWDAKAKAEEEP